MADELTAAAAGSVSLGDPALVARVHRVWDASEERYTRALAARVYFGDSVSEAAYERYYAQERGAVMPPHALYRIDGLAVRGKGILSIDRHVVRNNLEGAPVERIMREESAPDGAGMHREISEPVLYTSRYGVLNYGHCLTDILPRTVFCARLLPQVRVAVHPEMPRSILRAFEYLGIGPSALFALDEQPTLLRQAWFPDLWNRHPLVHSSRIFDVLRELREAVLASTAAQVPKWKGRRRLFVMRSDARTRRLVNQAEVSACLRTLGFSEVTCGGASLEDQVRMFREAECVVGIAGASMANMVFCRPGARVVVLAPSTMPALYFWDLAHHAHLDYRIGYFPAVEGGKGIHVDFKVDVGALADLCGD